MPEEVARLATAVVVCFDCLVLRREQTDLERDERSSPSAKRVAETGRYRPL